MKLKSFSVVKYERIWQTLFYLLKHEREGICETDTNKISWKKTKEFLSKDLWSQLSEYNPFGTKNEDYFAYQKLKFIERNIEGIDPDQVDEYSVALGKLLRWIQYALELRNEDIVARREHQERLKEERAAAIQAAEERDEKKNTELETAKAEFEAKVDADMAADEAKEDEAAAQDDGLEPGAQYGYDKEEKKRPEFDEAEFNAKFDEENPVIDIPPEVIDEVDNDTDSVVQQE
jgi:hypothetical protein